MIGLSAVFMLMTFLIFVGYGSSPPRSGIKSFLGLEC